MEIYWIKDKQRRGPASVPDVLDRIRLGELQPDALGWHTGVKGWKPLRELPALADLLQEDQPCPTEPDMASETAPAPPAQQETYATQTLAQESDLPAGLPPKPGIKTGLTDKLGINVPRRLVDEIDGECLVVPTAVARLLARGIDTLLYLVIALGALYAVGAPYNPYYLPSSPLFWLPMILTEAFCLSKWNTTPGKRLMRIYICTLGEHQELSFSRAFMRSLMAYILGMGMISFPFFPVMPIVAYWLLRKRGICWWDIRVLTFPIAKPARSGIMRVVLPIVILYLCLVAAGIFMKPWYKPMYEELYKADPAAARFMRQWIPELQGELPQEKPVPQPLD